MTLFVLLAALMLSIALAFLMLPLLRRRGRADNGEAEPVPASRTAFVTALLVALLLPAGAIGVYAMIGQPAAFNATNVAQVAPETVDMDSAIAGLAKRLQETPDDQQGWMLLGRAYQALGRFDDARMAIEKAHLLTPNDPDLTVEYAQALALSEPGRRIEGKTRQLLEEVLTLHPEHERALWLLGISDYQAGNYNAAIAVWNRLLPMLPAGSEIASSVRTQIADAEQLLNGSATSDSASVIATSATGQPAATTSADAPRFEVQVSLDPALADKLQPEATLFVFARAAKGPPLPLAIQKLKAGQLPLQVVLDDSMGMLPEMKLGMFDQIVIGARISASGDAMPQSGDLQVLSASLPVNHKQPVVLVINSIVP